jgi:hypothetical protein
MLGRNAFEISNLPATRFELLTAGLIVVSFNGTVIGAAINRQPFKSG